ncbi:uncharacterized protein FOMMEDRAFT_151353 [Fomitiporia mediterranea MF3/22]|uniref:uncharacterized protein n=1 Tax=Fomitiporia mediterranea (strain MF3/22) TaxID=694068 RepID=UPI0004407895|nr:uncharacterized protein FOMMEDRAFT_151353 [Fomitiporia mediterranea MF3/22]EJD08491.1 hypothetical protein FOMMEDRAFT_151353 [Fomitiporia mediterranea MF3/22]
MESASTQTPKPPPRPSNSTKPRTNATPSDKTPPTTSPRRIDRKGVQFKDPGNSTRAGAATEKEQTKPAMTSSGTQTRETGPKRGREERTKGRRENRRHDREESVHHKREDSLDTDREHRRDRDSTRDTDVRDSDTEREHHKEDSKGLLGKIFNRTGKGSEKSEKSETDRPRTGHRSRTSRYRQPRGRGEDASPSHRTSSEKKKAAADAARERAEKVHGSANDEDTDHGTRSSRRPRDTERHRGPMLQREEIQMDIEEGETNRLTQREEDMSSVTDSTARRRQSADSAAESRGVHPSHKSDKSRRVSRLLHEKYSYNIDVKFDPQEFTYGEKCSCCDQEKPFLKLPVPADVIRSLWEDGLFD